MRTWLRRLSVLQLCVLVVLALVILLKGTRLVWYGFNYAQLILRAVNSDEKRRADNLELLAQIQWDYSTLQTRYMKQICEDKGSERTDFTWLSALVNDEYVIPAVVLGHSIKTLSCVKKMLVLVSDEVSKASIHALERTGWSVKLVTAMDCRWLERKQGHMPASKGILGTHTRFHAWNYTQYSKIIYADPDYMLLSNMDELFHLSEDFAAAECARAGMVDPCFNAGLLVFRPSYMDYKAIMENWWTISLSDTCPNDQVLLWHLYADTGRWKPLPFAYNVRRLIHHPMKAFHFACCPPPKPWKEHCRPSSKEAKKFNGPLLSVHDATIMFWKMFYEAVRKYNLEEWWENTLFFKSDKEVNGKSYVECVQEWSLR